jgi:enoyl-CoA hydratase/carnithine racemase
MVATVTLDRARELNPLDRSTVAQLVEITAAIDRDPDIAVVVLRGEGRAFSAGGDLDGYLKLYRDPPAFMRFLRDLNLVLETIERSEKIYVAVVHGPCVAGGLELMLACDVALAADKALVSDGHLNFGQLPGAGGSQRLLRAVGPFRAKLLMLTGRQVDGREAERIGLVSLSVPAAELEAALQELLDGFAAKSPLGLRGAKYLVNTALGARDTALELELTYVHNYATTSHDAFEGLLAFKEKRSPRMEGR